MILVVAEQREGTLNRASWEAIAAAQQAGGPVKVAVLGIGRGRGRAGARRGRRRRGHRRRRTGARATTRLTVTWPPCRAIAQEQPAHVFLPHTYQTRDFAPALAARLRRALIADVTASRRRRTR